MRIEQGGATIELRTKNLGEASALLTRGALYSGVEWLNERDAEIIFLPNGIDLATLSQTFVSDEPLPAKTLLSNYAYLRRLIKRSQIERENEYDISNRHG